MAARELFEGFALQAVDLKGRVAIPADLRAAIERNAPDIRQVVLGRHPFDPCLSAHDVAWSKEKYDRIDRVERLAVDAGRDIDPRAKRRAFGIVEKVAFDDSGRFVIPPFFKQKAQIGSWAFFNGSGETFDIWAPEVLMKTDLVDEDVREICEYLCQQKGVKL
ncbi:division/cell wall cluster transcriptional repressor MraZ [Sphingomonas sp. AOB5]|uniref:division/cell wall cluster transcriptional repressor MraZ n=1 Tax=Sphingomonas sp. AOB5 TaxID=3034017 RepID=UPI0023F7EA48|nr:division/cell wall cluster transcriptional repressor MraZ [Sphingomonas sp. AOB5]MDF7775908.1 division/cell wall cluster transcriptional repressor MraZ [Sphingomonas sp. AOB5]